MQIENFTEGVSIVQFFSGVIFTDFFTCPDEGVAESVEPEVKLLTTVLAAKILTATAAWSSKEFSFFARRTKTFGLIDVV